MHKLATKDIEARWTKKWDGTHFAYKNHVKLDRDSKLIVEFAVSDAALHDSQAIVQPKDESDRVVYADSDYAEEELHR